MILDDVVAAQEPRPEELPAARDLLGLRAVPAQLVSPQPLLILHNDAALLTPDPCRERSDPLLPISTLPGDLIHSTATPPGEETDSHRIQRGSYQQRVCLGRGTASCDASSASRPRTAAHRSCT